MSNYIKIERVPYEEPYHVQLNWEISNGNIFSRFEYYDNTDSLIRMAENLEQFPKHSSDVFLYEIGSEKLEDNFAYYFRFRLFTPDAFGHSAIQIKFCNNNVLPYREMAEFCIRAEPAAINSLGKLLREFAKLEKEYLVWSETDSFIGGKYEYEYA